MALYEEWCDATKQRDKKKLYWCYTEEEGGRAKIAGAFARTVRTHYDRAERIAEDVDRLGYAGAAKILRKRLPTRPSARSGDLGEILASELVEEETGFRVPLPACAVQGWTRGCDARR